MLAGQFVGEAELAQGHEQIHLRDAEFDVLAGGRRLPPQHALRAALVVLRFCLGEDADLIDPA